MGVFLDWASVYQKDPSLFDPNETPDAKPAEERKAFVQALAEKTKFFGGSRYEESRSPEEKAAFVRALHTTVRCWPLPPLFFRFLALNLIRFFFLDLLVTNRPCSPFPRSASHKIAGIKVEIYSDENHFSLPICTHFRSGDRC